MDLLCGTKSLLLLSSYQKNQEYNNCFFFFLVLLSFSFLFLFILSFLFVTTILELFGLRVMLHNTALQHCFVCNIAPLCCAKNRCSKSSRVTSPLRNTPFAAFPLKLLQISLDWFSKNRLDSGIIYELRSARPQHDV